MPAHYTYTQLELCLILWHTVMNFIFNSILFFSFLFYSYLFTYPCILFPFTYVCIHVSVYCDINKLWIMCSIVMCVIPLSPCQNPPLLTTFREHLRYEKLPLRQFAQVKLCDATFYCAYLCPPPLTRGGWMRGLPLGGDFSTPAASVCWSLKKDRK